MSKLSFTVFWLLLGLVFAGDAAAQDADGQQAALRIADAQRAYDEQRYDDAVLQYQRAYVLSHDARLLLIIAHIYDRALREAVAARTYYELYLAADPLASDEVRSELAEVVRRAGIVGLSLGLEAGVDVHIDGQAPSDPSKPVELTPGPHRLIVSRAGRSPYETTLALSPGVHRMLVDLPPPPPDRRWAWAVTGLAVGTTAAWGTTAGVALVRDDRDVALAADVLLGIAVSTAVAGIVLWATE